jgi:hypothetical protein
VYALWITQGLLPPKLAFFSPTNKLPLQFPAFFAATVIKSSRNRAKLLLFLGGVLVMISVFHPPPPSNGTSSSECRLFVSAINSMAL